MHRYQSYELPETQKKCKAYTKSLLDWLVKTALERGIDVDGLIEAHKNEKDEREHEVPLAAFVSLAKSTVYSGVPLDEASLGAGMRDLDDNIRLRKEVNDYYRYNAASDTTYPYFIKVLSEVRGIFAPFVRDEKRERKTDVAQDAIPAGKPYLYFYKDSGRKETPSTVVVDDSTSKRLIRAQQLDILNFLYDMMHKRSLVRKTWQQYKGHEIRLSTAAIVTDLAMAGLERKLAALLSNSARSVTTISVSDSLREIPEDICVAGQNSRSKPSSIDVDDIFCSKALSVFEESRQPPQSINNEEAQKYTFKASVEYLERLRSDERARETIDHPVIDKFTEWIISSEDVSEPCKTFSLQILIDIQDIMAEDTGDTLTEAAKVALWVSDISPVGDLQKWKARCVEGHIGDGFDFREFLKLNPLLSGINQYDAQRKCYNWCASIMQRFVVCLCHLYNACQQVGGLSVSWPDLEFIIEHQGEKRIFGGTRPTIQSQFSSRLAKADKMRAKRKNGLSCLPAIDQIRSQFEAEIERMGSEDEPTSKQNLHRKDGEKMAADPKSSSGKKNAEAESAKEITELKAGFQWMAKALLPKSNSRRKKPVMKFSKDPQVCVELLSRLKGNLQERERHLDFDYPFFYFRAVSIVQQWREENLGGEDISNF